MGRAVPKRNGQLGSIQTILSRAYCEAVIKPQSHCGHHLPLNQIGVLTLTSIVCHNEPFRQPEIPSRIVGNNPGESMKRPSKNLINGAVAFIFCICQAASGSDTQETAQYSLAINNGRVIDPETGLVSGSGHWP